MVGVGVVICVFSWFLTANSQLTMGTITGTVTDPSGAAVPGVMVIVKNVDTGVSRSIVTGAAGHYEAASIPPGNYEVSASLAGFQRTIRTGISLAVGRTLQVDMDLEVGAVTQQITVSGEASLVDTTSATVSQIVDEKNIADLPLGGRDLTQLSFMQPGVLRIPTRLQQGVFGGMGENLSVGGARGTQNLYLLDGVSNSDLSGNPQGAAGTYVGAETVKEFQVITNNYSAEYRSQAGAIVSAVTKTGTNSLHGSLFWTLRNDILDAANFFDNAFGNPKPKFKRNQFGGSLGGPIVRDKTFFFGSYEGLRERLNTTDSARVPTLLARQGVLPKKTVVVSESIKPYLALYPVPGQGNALVEDYGDGTALIAGDQRQPTNDTFAAIRMDHNFSGAKAGLLSGTYNFNKGDRSPYGLLGDTTAGGLVSKKHVAGVTSTMVLSPTVLNQFHFGYSLTRPIGDIPLSKVDTSHLRFAPNRERMGQISASPLSSIGYRVERSDYEQRTISVKESFSITRGNHSMQLGMELNRFRYNVWSCSKGCNGIYTFRGLEQLLTATPRRFEAMLPGGDNPARNLSQILFGSYFQDNYSVTPSLTLNLGLRHEFATIPKEDDRRLSNLVNFMDSEVTVGKFYTNATLKSFSPRFGFAWAPGSRKTSFRGGFGVFYEHPMLYNIRTTLQELPPFTLVGRVEDKDANKVGRPIGFPNAYETHQDLMGAMISMRSMEYNMKTTYMYRWSFSLQHELELGWLVSAAYTGSRGLHLWQQGMSNINRWEGWPNQPTGAKYFPEDSLSINPNFAEMRTQAPNSNSFYHGLALGVQSRLSRGFRYQAAYSFSKSIDQGSGVTGGGDQLPTDQQHILFWDMHLHRGLSSFDIRHNFSANFTYELPFANDLAGIGGAIGKGWQLNGIVSLSTGHPISVLQTNSNVQEDRFGFTEGLTPDLVPGGNANPIKGTTAGCPGGVDGLTDVAAGQKLGTPELYFDVCQFLPGETGYFGTLGKHTMTAPGFAAFDMSIYKNFSVGEGKRLQFRGEFFNLFNRANFYRSTVEPFQPDATRENPIRDKAAGQITQTRTPARQIQLGLRFEF